MALNHSPAYYLLLNAEVSIQLEDQGRDTGVVKRRARDSDANMVGQYDNNPFINYLAYEVKFPDGYVKEYSSTIISENMLTQVYSEVYSLTMINVIIDYDCDDSVAVPKSDGYVVTKHGQRRPIKLMLG